MMFQCSDKLGLSLELGSFAAGLMISTTDLAHHTLEQVYFSFFYGTLSSTLNIFLYVHLRVFVCVSVFERERERRRE